MIKRSARWLLLTIVLALVIIPNAPRGPIGQPPRVQATGWALLTHTAQGAGSSAAVTTTAISSTGGSLIVLGLGCSCAFNPASLTDSASNTPTWWTKTINTGAADVTLIFYVSPTTSGTHTFTYNQSSTFPSLAVEIFSGSYVGIQDLRGAAASATTTVQTGSLTPFQNNALFVSAYSNTLSSGSPTFSIDSGFTKTDQIVGAANPTPIALAYLIQTAAAAVNPTWTSSTSTNNVANQVVVNQVQSSSGGGETSHVFGGGS